MSNENKVSSTQNASQRYKFFKPEERGIELIPAAEQKMKPISLFWLWAGAIFNVEFLVYGALIVSFGLSFGQALVIIVLGNLAYFAVGVMSIQGPITGTTAMMVGRGVFGRRGNNVPSFFNWITQEGYEVLGLVLVVLLVSSMFTRSGVQVHDGLKLGILAVAVVVQFILPFLGHAAIEKTLRYLSYIFIVVFTVMAFLVIPHVDLGKMHQHASWQLLTSALVLIVSAGGLGWTENANDYSRYIPSSASKSRVIFSAALGGMIPSILLEILGALAYTVSPQVTAVTGVPSAFAGWFFWPFAILALPQLFSIGTIDLYSAGVTLESLGLAIKRTYSVVVNILVAGIVTFIVVTKGNLYTDLSGFLDYTLVWLAPWFAIYISDYLLRRGRYDLDGLVTDKGGVYWRNGGFNGKALVALGLGMLAALLWVNGKYYVPSFIGPISTATGGADFSWIMGIVVGAIAYYFLSVRSISKEIALLDTDTALANGTAGPSNPIV